MSLVIDQSWVSAWQTSLLSPGELAFIQKWVQDTPASVTQLLRRFPPLSLVRGKVRLEVPYPYTVGIVASYREDGFIGVQQEPTTEAVLVRADDLEVVGFWKSFNPIHVTEILRTRSLGL